MRETRRDRFQRVPGGAREQATDSALIQTKPDHLRCVGTDRRRARVNLRRSPVNLRRSPDECWSVSCESVSFTLCSRFLAKLSFGTREEIDSLFHERSDRSVDY